MQFGAGRKKLSFQIAYPLKWHRDCLFSGNGRWGTLLKKCWKDASTSKLEGIPVCDILRWGEELASSKEKAPLEVQARLWVPWIVTPTF